MNLHTTIPLPVSRTGVTEPGNFAAAEAAPAPWFTGNFAPVATECDAPHLPVTGDLPRELDGTLFRNGPNPQFMPLDPMHHHWFSGDGMLHAFTLRNGRASYRNRWVRTAKWQAEHAAGRPLTSGYRVSPRP